ncbi:MAG TPA: Amuc_1100 family pilus-like protein [Verrucomicrobiota bacterium]|nr:Amuc_1100 family pilus-like protein [Verrucomicrobiota bacterium]
MDWVKKNLLLVVSGAVTLVLLGVAGYFLWSKHTLEARVTEDLATQTSELNQLSNSDPHPGNEKVKNIEAAKEQDKKLQEFVAEARKTFVPIEYPTNLDSGQLKLLLDTVIDELHRKADGMGVKLQSDPKYAFTFGAQRTQMYFDQKDILPTARMMVDIKTIATMLFDARVLALDGIRRCTVSSLDTPGAEFWNKKPTTNDTYGAVLTPYEFTFHCFTPELNRVVESLYRSPHAFLLKSVVVDTSPSQLLERPADGSAEPMGPMMMPGMNMAQLQMMLRYGGRGAMRYATPPPQEVPPPTARGGLTPLLDEKPFRAVLWVESVRLLDPEEIKAAKAAARTSRPVRAVTPEGGEPGADPTATGGETPAEPAPDAPPVP